MKVWAEANDLVRRHPLIAHAILVAGVAIALFQADEANDKQATETEQRREIVAEIINDSCNDNNAQDGILATLVRVSLESSTVPEEQLTQQQQGAKHVFEDALAELEDPENCQIIIAAFLDGDTDVESLKAILRGGREGTEESQRPDTPSE